MAPVSGLCGVVALDGAEGASEAVEAMVRAAPYRGRAGWFRKGGGVALAQQHTGPHAELFFGGQLVAVGSVRLDDRAGLVGQLGDRSVDLGSPDLALVAAAYRRWGDSCVEHLLGDYSFAVFHMPSRRLFLARDPMGMRPLYLRVESGRRILFASEAAQILAVPGIPCTINQQAVAAHLLLADHDTLCFYEGIECIGPGEVVHVDREGGLGRHRRAVLQPGPLLRYRTQHEYVAHFRELFADVVRDRLGTDERVGILLSGGMDSGSVAAMAGSLRSNDGAGAQLHSYSWAYETHPECDERSVSSVIVDAYGFVGRDISDVGAWPLGDLPACGPHRDDPMLGGFQVLIERALAAAAAEGVTAMLGGDRGDLLAGPLGITYPRLVRSAGWSAAVRELRAERVVGDWNRISFLRHEILAPIAGALGRVPRRLGSAASRRFHGAESVRAERWRWVRRDLVDLLPDLDPSMEPTDGLPGSLSRRRLILNGEQMRGMQWSERTYARHGVAFVDPWSDLRLAQFAVDVPQGVLNRGGEPYKRLVRHAMAGIMPERARLAANKTLPTSFFINGLQGPASGIVRDLSTESEIVRRGWVDHRGLSRQVEAVLAGAEPSPELWRALTLEVWVRQHFS